MNRTGRAANQLNQGEKMAVDSKYHRFREAGEQANINNVEEYGVPARSLFTSTKVFTLHHHIDITDNNGNIVYQAETQFPSIHDKTDITDAKGVHVAHIERKLLTLHERHFISMADGTAFELSNELLHFIKDITNIEGLGWQLRGNILGLNFTILDENGDTAAVIGQKMLSIHDKYCIDIYKPEHEHIIVAILVTLQHMMSDRAAAGAAGGGGGSAE